MYIRNAQGKLVWIPPQGLAPAPQPTLHEIQQNMRHQVQRDEWTRFNAPPPADNLCFHDDYSHYEGSVANGYRNTALPFNSPQPDDCSHYGGSVANGYRNTALPFNSPQPDDRSHYGGSVANGYRNTALPFNSPQPDDRSHYGGSVANGYRNTALPFNSPQPDDRSHYGGSVANGYRNTALPFNSGGSVASGYRNSALPFNSGGSVASGYRNTALPFNSPKVANYGNMMYRRQESFNQLEPPVPHVIHSTPMLNNQNQRINSFAPSFRTPGMDNSVAHPPRNNLDLIEEEYTPDTNVSCMTTIFGSSVDLYRTKDQSIKSGLMDCNPLNISTSDDVEFDENSLSHHIHPQNQPSAQRCNGVRGPGKKFEYPAEEKTFPILKSLDNSINDKSPNYYLNDAVKRNINKDVDRHGENKKIIEDISSSFREKSDVVESTSSHKKSMNSHSTRVAITENDSVDDRSDIAVSVVHWGEEKIQHKEENIIFTENDSVDDRSDIAVSVVHWGEEKIQHKEENITFTENDSVDDRSDIAVSVYMAEEKIQHKEENITFNSADDFDEGIKLFEKSCQISSKRNDVEEETEERRNERDEFVAKEEPVPSIRMAEEGRNERDEFVAKEEPVPSIRMAEEGRNERDEFVAKEEPVPSIRMAEEGRNERDEFVAKEEPVPSIRMAEEGRNERDEFVAKEEPVPSIRMAEEGRNERDEFVAKEEPVPSIRMAASGDYTYYPSFDERSVDDYPSFDEPAKAQSTSGNNDNQSTQPYSLTNNLSDGENGENDHRCANVSPRGKKIDAMKKNPLASSRDVDNTVLLQSKMSDKLKRRIFVIQEEMTHV